MHIGGAPLVNLFASTSGTDSDWVVKLIDVYPEEVPSDPPMGGYQLPIGMDIFRGRYRESLEHPERHCLANKVQRYRFALPMVDHVFLPGHRMMVQIQSSWFPLYDRNPQTYVDNIFLRAARRTTARRHSGCSMRPIRRRSSRCRWWASCDRGAPGLELVPRGPRGGAAGEVHAANRSLARARGDP